jgi:hypothetical protein
MATGLELARILLRMAELTSGHGFMAIIDLDLLPNMTSYEINKAEEEARQRIEAIIAPIQTLAEKLSNSCWGTGVIFKDPKRGIGVKTEQQLTKEQNNLFNQLVKEIESTDTFIRNP